MAEGLVQTLGPIREQRSYYENHPEMVTDIMRAGNEQANQVARDTMKEVREAVGI
jgi:tryptophanyl-tRNA synthetase